MFWPGHIEVRLHMSRSRCYVCHWCHLISCNICQVCHVTCWSTDNVAEHEVASQAQEEDQQIQTDGPVTEGGKIRAIKKDNKRDKGMSKIHSILKIVSKCFDLLTWIPRPVQLQKFSLVFSVSSILHKWLNTPVHCSTPISVKVNRSPGDTRTGFT